MAITSIQFNDDTNTSATVTYDDGSVVTVAWPCQTWHQEEIQAWLDAGNTVAAAPAVDPWIEIRAKRDMLLKESDWTQLPDAVLPGTSTLTDWQTYRQQLRDIPQTYTDPATVIWPTQPA